MPILTAAAGNTQPDYVALAMVLALALVVVILAVRKKLSKKKKTETAQVIPVAQECCMADAPGSAGQIKLHNVEPRTAAMVMAIVADRMEKPLNELRFISVKEVE